MLMERHDLTADQAFALLVRVSQKANVKLRDIAERIVLRRVPPAVPRPSRRTTGLR